MKKIIAITAMAAMVAAAAMADEPVAEMGVDLSGDATLTWGVDLDEGDTGFKNEANAKAVVTFVKGGTKSTEGDGVWAEVGVKFDGDLKYKLDGDGSEDFKKDGGKIALDVAKLHIGDLYIGLKSGDIQIGEVKLPSAVFAASKDARLGLANVGQKDVSQGLVAGYGTDDFGIAVDFRSIKATHGAAAGAKFYEVFTNATGVTQWYGPADEKGTIAFLVDDDADPSTPDVNIVDEGKAAKGYTILRTQVVGADDGTTDYFTNHYGLAAEAELKDSNAFVPGLGIKAGVSYAFEEKNLGISASAGYKVPVGETFYIKPTVAIAGSKVGDGDFGANLGASVVFGWGDQAGANPGVYYLDSDDESKEVIPGVSVAMLMPLTGDNKSFEIVPAFYSGDIVPGLKAAVLGDITISTVDGVDPTFGVAAGLSYELAVGDAIKVTPKAGFRFANVNGGTSLPAISKKNTDNGGYTDVAAADGEAGLLNVKAGVDISGLIENTTFGAYYQSRNLKALKENGKAGTFNVFVKVSL